MQILLNWTTDMCIMPFRTCFILSLTRNQYVIYRLLEFVLSRYFRRGACT